MSELCKQIVTHQPDIVGRISNGECGNPVKYHLKYKTDAVQCEKNVCGLHLKTLRIWLDRIKAEYSFNKMIKEL